MNRKGRILVPVQDFKYDNEKGTFTCYGNVKNIIDHAQDRTVEGCFRKSIQRHKSKGTMPKQLWMHNPFGLPVGPWLDMDEDSIGLKMTGKLSDTTMGRDIRVLAEDKALDSFSIGYTVIEERRNQQFKCNDLIEVDIMEVSWVNWACNEESRLQEMKSKLRDGGLLSKSELRELLKTVPGLELSKREIERITANYNPKDETEELKKMLESSPFFQ